MKCVSGVFSLRQDESEQGHGADVVCFPVLRLAATRIVFSQIGWIRGHRIAGIFGYSQLTGGYPGDQAEYCRVPNADLVLVKAPKEGVSPEKLLGLADVTTTAWHGTELAEVGKGDVVGVWGCGPVGLSIARLSFFRGAKRVYAVDPDPERLKIAEKFGCIGIDVGKHPDVADFILDREPQGLDRTIEASGFRGSQSWLHSTMRAIGKSRNSQLLLVLIFQHLLFRYRGGSIRHRHPRNQGDS